MRSDADIAVEFKDITKRFGSVTACDGVSLTIKKGEILALLGENGSGKTTLVNMLSGIYFPDEGKIVVDGETRVIRSPKDAFSLGIGMVHQHFMLVDTFSATENIVLGIEEKGSDLRSASQKVREIIETHRFKLDPDEKVYEMSVSEKQTVEIIKVLYRGADLLILDEPTAVLTPQEIERLFDILKSLKAEGKTIVIITHKLSEVMEISDRVAVLRKGRYVGTVETSGTTPMELTEMMVGHAVRLNIERTEPIDPKPRLEIKNLTVIDDEKIKKLDDVSFTAMSGEILGIAGIAGSGQRELLEAISGLYPVKEGSIIYSPEGEKPRELIGKSPAEIKRSGIVLAFVPEDRLGMGLVGGMGMVGNMMLRSWRGGPGAFVHLKQPTDTAMRIKDELNVLTPDLSYPVRRLSGGNIQKVLVGREISSHPSVLMSAYAVRGLDINTSYTIYNLMAEQKSEGAAVIFVGEDLDVLLELCDKILVLSGGRVSGMVDARKASKEEIGLMMTASG